MDFTASLPYLYSMGDIDTWVYWHDVLKTFQRSDLVADKSKRIGMKLFRTD
jgi:hypothetical protein